MFSELSSQKIQKLIFTSIEQALYQAIVVIDNHEHLVWESDTKTVHSRNLMQLREKFKAIEVPQTVLRHESPYDEMIGQPQRVESNVMEVPLSKNPYATAKWLH